MSSGDDLLHASALVVGPREGAAIALTDLARSLGFEQVERYRGVAAAEKQSKLTPLVFFLCAAVADAGTLKSTAETVRSSANPQMRFSPLIYFAHDLSVAVIRQCIQMGFDDVVALPYGGGDLRQRIARQVGQSQIYYETGSYFGPDRRNRLGEAREDQSRGGGQVRRFEIMRHFDSGIDVLSDDTQVEV